MFYFVSVESVNFEAPLMTELRAETEERNVGASWNNGSNHSHSNKESEEDLNLALDEALENYDLATSWMEGDGEKEVVRK